MIDEPTKPAATVPTGKTAPPPPGGLSKGPPDDVERRLGKLEKLSTTVVIAFIAKDNVVIDHDIIWAHPNNKIHWQVVAADGVDLDYVVIEFAAGKNYFPSEAQKNRKQIDITNGTGTAEGKVHGNHKTGIDKYSVSWRFSDATTGEIDPIIIVTDP